MQRSLLVIGVLFFLAGCAQAPSENRTKPTYAQEANAAQVYEDLEKLIKKTMALPPKESRAQMSTWDERFRSAYASTKGTKSGNKVLHLWAWWRFDFTAVKGSGPTLEILDLLDKSPEPHVKEPGTLLRVRVLARRGDISQAKQLAIRWDDGFPEFALKANAILRAHALVGSTVATCPARSIGSGPADPSTRNDPIQAWIHVGSLTTQNRFVIERFLTQCPPGIRPVIVTSDASPLVAASLARLPGADRADILWVSATDHGQWANTWQLFDEGVCYLVGPSRLILAVDVPMEQIAAAVDGQMIR